MAPLTIATVRPADARPKMLLRRQGVNSVMLAVRSLYCKGVREYRDASRQYLYPVLSSVSSGTDVFPAADKAGSAVADESVRPRGLFRSDGSGDGHERSAEFGGVAGGVEAAAAAPSFHDHGRTGEGRDEAVSGQEP